MPLGIISDDELLKELSNSTNAVVKDMPDRGRPEGKKEVPEIIREIVAEESLEGAKSKELQQLFNVSASSVSAYKNGATSTANYNNGNGELAKKVSATKERISNRAEGKLMHAIRSMTREKFEKAGLRDLAGVAREMSVVIKNMEPPVENNGNSINAQFVFHVPPMKTDEDYQIIEVKE